MTESEKFVCSVCGSDVTFRMHESEKKRVRDGKEARVSCRTCQCLTVVKVMP